MPVINIHGYDMLVMHIGEWIWVLILDIYTSN